MKKSSLFNERKRRTPGDGNIDQIFLTQIIKIFIHHDCLFVGVSNSAGWAISKK